MKSTHLWFLLGLTVALAGAGCKESSESGDRQYDLKGKVVAVDSAQKSVTLAHQDIPGLMQAMTMEFQVANPQLLAGIKPGVQVQAQLTVTAGNHMNVTQLKQVSETAAASPGDEDPDVKEGRAALSPEDRSLVEAQDYCPVEGDNRLGAMGKPFKVVIKGQPVFLCCKGCKDKALADPDRTLGRVEELKAKTAPPRK